MIVPSLLSLTKPYNYRQLHRPLQIISGDSWIHHERHQTKPFRYCTLSRECRKWKERGRGGVMGVTVFLGCCVAS